MPEGRLVMSFPLYGGQAPLFYNSFPPAGPTPSIPREKFTSRYLDAPNEPLYPFGYGLGYSPVSYGDLQLSGDCLRPGKVLQAEITVTNAGDRYPVTETVQLYIRDVAGSLVRPLRSGKVSARSRCSRGKPGGSLWKSGRKCSGFITRTARGMRSPACLRYIWAVIRRRRERLPSGWRRTKTDRNKAFGGVAMECNTPLFFITGSPRDQPVDFPFFTPVSGGGAFAASEAEAPSSI